MVRISETFCAQRNSFIALSNEFEDIDTFTLKFPENPSEFTPPFWVDMRYSVCPSSYYVHRRPDSYYQSYSHGDSIVLDWFDAPDCSFEYYSPVENNLHTFRYRLKFNGFLRNGRQSDTLFARIDYLNLAHEKIHDSAHFIMTKVK